MQAERGQQQIGDLAGWPFWIRTRSTISRFGGHGRLQLSYFLILHIQFPINRLEFNWNICIRLGSASDHSAKAYPCYQTAFDCNILFLSSHHETGLGSENFTCCHARWQIPARAFFLDEKLVRISRQLFRGSSFPKAWLMSSCKTCTTGMWGERRNVTWGSQSKPVGMGLRFLCSSWSSGKFFSALFWLSRDSSVKRSFIFLRRYIQGGEEGCWWKLAISGTDFDDKDLWVFGILGKQCFFWCCCLVVWYNVQCTNLIITRLMTYLSTKYPPRWHCTRATARINLRSASRREWVWQKQISRCATLLGRFFSPRRKNWGKSLWKLIWRRWKSVLSILWRLVNDLHVMSCFFNALYRFTTCTSQDRSINILRFFADKKSTFEVILYNFQIVSTFWCSGVQIW